MVDRNRLEELRSTLYKVTPLRAEDLDRGELEKNGWFVDVFAPGEDPLASVDDPILDIADQIAWSDRALMIGLTGGTGVGKTTQLGRLAGVLWREHSIACVTVDYGEFSELSSPPDVTDFLLSVVGGFAQRAAEQGFLPEDWDRQTIGNGLLGILKRLKMPEAKIGLGGAATITVQDLLSQDETFRARVREHLASRVSEVLREVRGYAGEVVGAILEHLDGCKGVVLVVDSTEKLAGPRSSQERMYSAVRHLFVENGDNLAFREFHTIYLLPPWLPVSDGGALRMTLCQFPAVRVERRQGDPDDQGIDLMCRIIRLRMPDIDELIAPEDLRRLCLMSGGVQRVFFQLLSVVARRARSTPTMPVPSELIDSAIATIREDYLAVTIEAAPWLARIQETRGLDGLPSTAVASLGAYFQAMVVLQFANGTKWYAIHPLMRDRVKRSISDDG
ncbi:MAG: hypothetical protein QOH12_2015 [Solirubrobacteraceae bacterium]|nr:hypothetical protein [Solirubrobacteraceae bacterium]